MRLSQPAAHHVINVICAARLKQLSIAECQSERHHIIPADIVQATARDDSFLILRRKQFAHTHVDEVYGFRIRRRIALVPAFEI